MVSINVHPGEWEWVPVTDRWRTGPAVSPRRHASRERERRIVPSHANSRLPLPCRRHLQAPPISALLYVGLIRGWLRVFEESVLYQFHNFYCFETCFLLIRSKVRVFITMIIETSFFLWYDMIILLSRMKMYRYILPTSSSSVFV